MKKKHQKHEDTSISLSPLTFDEAIEKLANAPKQTDSQAEESDSTKGHAPESDPSKKRSARGPKSSDD